MALLTEALGLFSERVLLSVHHLVFPIVNFHLGVLPFSGHLRVVIDLHAFALARKPSNDTAFRRIAEMVPAMLHELHSHRNTHIIHYICDTGCVWLAAGLATRCTIQIAYAIGVSEPLSLYVDTHDTGTAGDDKIEAAILAGVYHNELIFSDQMLASYAERHGYRKVPTSLPAPAAMYIRVDDVP